MSIEIIGLIAAVGVIIWLAVLLFHTRRNLTEERTHFEVERMRFDLERSQTTERAERERQEREQLKSEFKNLATEILEQKTQQFRTTNEEELNKILNPFRDNLRDFRERVEKIYGEEREQQGSLKSELAKLATMNASLTKEASDLTSALRGNSKIQGDWGEMILDRLLEASGLVRDVHYSVQEVLKNEAGQNLRPDVILRLPDEKPIIIDSKVSLSGYANYVNADDDTTAKTALAEHLRSVRAHIRELRTKDYAALLGNTTPGFVVMFIPNEPAFLEALRADNTLWQEAYESKVIISSPTNLMAVLKIVLDLWKRDDQNRNALAIAEAGANMYDKFVGFVETLESVGRGLKTASDNYDKAMGQLSTGRGNLISRAETMHRLGLKTTKRLAQQPADED